MQHPRSLIVLLAVLASGGLAARASAAPATANPCKVLAGTAIAATVDWGSSLPAGTLSSRPDGQAKQLVCTFKKGTGTLELTLAPHQGPRGLRRPARDGGHASLGAGYGGDLRLRHPHRRQLRQRQLHQGRLGRLGLGQRRAPSERGARPGAHLLQGAPLSRRHWAAGVLAPCAAALLLSAPAVAATGFFATPSGNIVCPYTGGRSVPEPILECGIKAG